MRLCCLESVSMTLKPTAPSRNRASTLAYGVGGGPVRLSPSTATSMCPAFKSPDRSAGPTTTSTTGSVIELAPAKLAFFSLLLLRLFLLLKPTTIGPAYSFLSSILIPSHLPSNVISKYLFVPFMM